VKSGPMSEPGTWSSANPAMNGSMSPAKWPVERKPGGRVSGEVGIGITEQPLDMNVARDLLEAM